MAVVLSLAIAATAMFTSAFAVTINGTVEEGDVTGIVIDLGADYPVLLDAASWAAGVEVDFTYDFENEIVEVAEGYGNGCGGNAGLYIKYGEAYSWQDKNNWSYDVNWMADKALECNTAVLQFDTKGAAIMEAGFRLYNFQQKADGDLDSQLVGNGITVEILDIRVGGESILGDAPVDTDVATDAPVDTDVATDAPVDTDVATDAPVDTDVTTDAPVVEVPEGAYIKATVDAAAGKVTLSTVNFPEEIYGLQYTLDFTGATYAGMEKGKLPAGWSETYPKDADIATGFTAALDCDFSTVLADQDILVINFTDAADIEVAISGAKAVNGAFQGVEVASYVEYVEAPVDTETEVPVEPETDTDEPATDKPADTNTDVKGDEPSTGDVDTGVVGFASILGVVALAGAVASKKR